MQVASTTAPTLLVLSNDINGEMVACRAIEPSVVRHLPKTRVLPNPDNWVYWYEYVRSKLKCSDRLKLGAGGRMSSGNVPEKIKIRCEKGYHTSSIGKVQDGTQFMGFIVGVDQRTGSNDVERKVRWYAVLHRFDADGNHLRTKTRFLGKKAYASQLDKANAKLAIMIKALGRVKYCDVEVKLFSVKEKGILFGLIDESVPKQRYQRIDLIPEGLAFFPPWDGSYET